MIKVSVFITYFTILKLFFIKILIRDESDSENDDDNETLSDWLERDQIQLGISNIDEYVEIDAQVLVAESPSDEEIINDLRQDHELSDEEEDDEVEVLQRVSNTEALQALNTLRTYYETNDFIDDNFFLYCSRMKLSITNYVNSKKNKTNVNHELF